LKAAVIELFEDDYENENYLPVSEVNNLVKKWCVWAYNEGKISREHRRPSTHQIKKAMDNAGFYQTMEHEIDEYGNKISLRVYQDIKRNPDLILKNKK